MTRRRIQNFVDPTAEVDPSARIWHFAVVLAEVMIGPNVNIGSGCEIGRGSVIGTGTRIGSGSFLPPNSVIGRNVFIGPGVFFADDMHPKVPEPGEPPYDARPPIVEDGASIGIRAVVLPGVRIGAGARVGAGAIVTRDVPAGALYYGTPAREHVPSERSEGWVRPS